MNKTLNNIFKGDKVIWMVFFFLCLISIVEVYSASSMITYRSGNYLAPIIKHGGILMMGVVAAVVVLNIPCKYFKIITPAMLILSILTLLWLIIAGSSTNGAQRWLSLAGIQFQPSEIAKGTLVLATAQILSATQTPEGAAPAAFKYIMWVTGIIALLIGVENLSTAALLCITIFMMMLIGRVPMRQLGKLLGVCVLAIATMFSAIMLLGNTQNNTATQTSHNVTNTTLITNAATTEDVQEKKEESGLSKIFHRLDTWKGRIERFANTKEVPAAEVDLRDKGAQAAFAKIAIVSSDIKGKGPGNSDQRDFLSQAFSDFIYAIIIEELGIAGAIFVALLYIILLFRTARIASRCENNFPAFLAMGLTLMLVTQALFNMCVAVGLAPVTGQPLPLISKGGTSTIINCIYIGALLSISRTARKKGTTAPVAETAKA